MKRCPECKRDYYEDRLIYCLDDGTALLEGPTSMDEPATAVFGVPPSDGQSDLEKTRILAAEPETLKGETQNRFDERLLVAALVLAIIGLAGFFGYRWAGSSGGGQINSIAVLPFQNRSGDDGSPFMVAELPDACRV